MRKHFMFLLSLLALLTVSAQAWAYDTSYDVATIEGGTFIDNGVVQNGKSSISKSKAIDPAINLSNRDIEQLYLVYDATIIEENAGDAAVLNRLAAQIELTSSGKNDVNELTLDFKQSWKTGTNTYYVPLLSGGETGGKIDYSNVNYIRMYATSVPSDFTGKVTMTVKNVRIIDQTTLTRMPTIFSDGMLVQQNKNIPIWGYGAAGKTITAKLLKGDTEIDMENTTIGTDGKWKVTFPAQKASYDTYKITVTDNENVNLTINDILVGELWVAGGQSNMALSVSDLQIADSLIKDVSVTGSKYFRFFYEPTYPYSRGARPMPMEPRNDILGGYWGYGNNGVDVAQVSAVAYMALKELQAKLNIPVGFLYTPVGGSVIEAWIPRQKLEANTDLVNNIKSVGRYFASDATTTNTQAVTCLYNQKVGPLAGINVAGTLWYQGESNSNYPQYYADELLTLKRGWERTFNFEEGTMPFVFCQVCRWATDFDDPQYLAKLDEAMSDAFQRGQNMSLLPLYDTNMSWVGNAVIHPTYKKDTGHRFYTAIYNKVYNTGEESTAAIFKSAEVKDGKIVVTFDHVGTGLKTRDGSNEVRGFAIAGANGVYANADATISAANQVTVSNPGIADPQFVTYAFTSWNFDANLENSVGIPAAPFRSDRTETNLYYNPQDWTSADKDQFWAFIKNSDETDKIHIQYPAYFPTFTSTNGTTTIDKNVKALGLGSLKYTYTKGGLVGPASQDPVTKNPYLSLVPQIENFSSITVQVKNPDAREKSINVKVITLTGDTLTSKTAVTVPASANFQTITLPLTAFVNANGTNAKPLANKLKSAKGILFQVNDDQAGTLYFDNFLFGGAAVPEFTTNAVIESKQDIADLVAGYDKVTVKMALDAQDIADLRTYVTNNAIDMLDLTDAEFPNNEIPEDAFNGASQLKGVTIPSSVTLINRAAFANCSKLASVQFPEGCKLETINGGKFGDNKGVFSNCQALTSITLPKSLKTLGANSFRGDANLASVTFEEGSQLQSLQDAAFINCTKLTSIALPNTVDTLQQVVFSDCTNLENVTIASGSNSLKWMGIRAFINCTSLKSLTLNGDIPNTRGDQIFYNISNLGSVKLYVPNQYVDKYKAHAVYGKLDVIGYNVSTGINAIATDVNNKKADKVWYDLQGRRVSKPSHGLYIVNGKKVVVK